MAIGALTDARVKLALEIVRHVEKVVASAVHAEFPREHRTQMEKMIHTRVERTLQVYCALDLAASVYRTGPA